MSEGQTHILNVHEGAPTEDEVVGGEPQIRRKYRVITGVILNGKTYESGDEDLILDPDTASRFIEIGDIEEIA